MLELLLLGCASPDPAWQRGQAAPELQPPQALAEGVLNQGVAGELHHLAGQPLLINGLGIHDGEHQLLTPGWAQRGAPIGEALWVADAESGVAIVAAKPLRIVAQLPLGYVSDLAPFQDGALVLLRSGALLYLNAQGETLQRWPIPGSPRALSTWQAQGQWRWAVAAGVAGVVQGDGQGPIQQSFLQNSVAIAAPGVAGGLSGRIHQDNAVVADLGARLRSGLRAGDSLWFTAGSGGVWRQSEPLRSREGAEALGLSYSEELVWVSWSDGLVEGLEPDSGARVRSLHFPMGRVDRVDTQGRPYADQDAWLARLDLSGVTSSAVNDAQPAPDGIWWTETERGLCREDRCFPTLHGGAVALDLQITPSGTRAAGFSHHDGSVVRVDGEEVTRFPGRGMGEDVALFGPLVVVSERRMGVAAARTPGQWQTLPLPQGDPIFGREQRFCQRGAQLMVTQAEYGVAILEIQDGALVVVRRVNTPGLAVACASAGDQGWWVADRAGVSRVAP